MHGVDERSIRLGINLADQVDNKQHSDTQKDPMSPVDSDM